MEENEALRKRLRKSQVELDDVEAQMGEKVCNRCSVCFY